MYGRFGVYYRQMKKDKKYFMEKLPCGILRMKRDNTIEELRGPITASVTYEEVIHGSLGELLSFHSKYSPNMKNILHSYYQKILENGNI